MISPVPFRTPLLSGDVASHPWAKFFEDIHRAVTTPVAQPTLTVAQPSAPVTLTALLQDLPSATLTLADAGTYLISATWDFVISGAGDVGVFLVGNIVANGVVIGPSGILESPVEPFRATVFQHCKYVAAAGDVVKLQASKTGGTGASSADMHSLISALWIGH